MSTCTFPRCHHMPTVSNRAGQETCKHHRAVVITGSWVGDRHDATSGGEH